MIVLSLLPDFDCRKYCLRGKLNTVQLFISKQPGRSKKRVVTTPVAVIPPRFHRQYRSCLRAVGAQYAPTNCGLFINPRTPRTCPSNPYSNGIAGAGSHIIRMASWRRF